MSKQEKELFVFDFDHTLVHVDGAVYVVNSKTGKKKEISFEEYHHYDLKKDEDFDVSEFERTDNPIKNEEMFEILLAHPKNSVILTAREHAKPVKDYLMNLGIKIPVNAVGVYIRGKNTNFINADRKKDWIKRAIKKGGFTHIHFYDDNGLNITQVDLLKKELPDVTIKTHYITWADQFDE